MMVGLGRQCWLVEFASSNAATGPAKAAILSLQLKLYMCPLVPIIIYLLTSE